jgi:hypothetical protein
MNINEVYANIPADQHGNIAVSEAAITITQNKKAAVVLLKKTANANAELTDSSGKSADRAHLEKNIIALKPVTEVDIAKLI